MASETTENDAIRDLKRQIEHRAREIDPMAWDRSCHDLDDLHERVMWIQRRQRSIKAARLEAMRSAHAEGAEKVTTDVE